MDVFNRMFLLGGRWGMDLEGFCEVRISAWVLLGYEQAFCGQ